MKRAYDGRLIDRAMNNLGDAVHHAVYDCGLAPDEFFGLFIKSGIAAAFGAGDPRYIADISGNRLFSEIRGALNLEAIPSTLRFFFTETPERWAGRVIAYYQWRTSIPFAELSKKLVFSFILTLHAEFKGDEPEKIAEVLDGYMKSA